MAKASTRKYLDIAEIREDIVILKDGTLRSVIMCSSINFALKSEEEQNAAIFGYIEFLNSLDHPMQIVVQSRKLNVDNYLERLNEALRVQTNELLKIQIAGYIDYIKQLIELGEIMTKKFFVVVPYNPLGDKNKSFFSRLSEAVKPGLSITIKKDKLAKYKEALNLRVNNVMTNLKSMGIDSVLLDTQGLIELYYNIYNPVTSQSQKLGDISQLGIER